MSTPATQSSQKFPTLRFWGIRLMSVLLVVGILFALQYWLVPNLGIYDKRLIVLALLFATLAVSLNLINGVTGQFSIGHAAFYLIGAYLSGKITVSYFKDQPIDEPIWLLLMVIVGGIGAALAGILVGLPSLRLRGDYLAIATLGFGEIAVVFVRNQDGNPATSLFGLDLGGAYAMQINPKMTEIAYVILLFIVAIAVARNLLKTAHGLSFLAVREDELAAESMGVNTTKVKVTAFVIGAAIAGMAGALYSHYNGVIGPDDFKMDVSFMIVAMVVIGGTGSITGAALAGICLKLLEEGLREVRPIPAIVLLSYIIVAIVIYGVYRSLHKQAVLNPDKTLKPLYTLVGTVAIIGALYATYSLWGTNLSYVIKSAGTALILGAIIAILYHKNRTKALPRFGMLTISGIILYFVSIPVASALSKINFINDLIGETNYQPSDLRWPIFAIALVFIMLLRPQGLFGHHELSWSWIAGLFGKRTPKTAVSS